MTISLKNYQPLKRVIFFALPVMLLAPMRCLRGDSLLLFLLLVAAVVASLTKATVDQSLSHEP